MWNAADGAILAFASGKHVFANDLFRGALITVKTRKTTCHRLPIGGSE